MITFELRYVNTGASIIFTNVNSVLGSNNDIIFKAKEEGISVTGTESNPILLFFDEQHMYRFLRYISTDILWYPFQETQNIFGSLVMLWTIN